MEREVILSRLLDKYENSRHLTQPGASNRRVMLRVDKRELPEYDRESAAVRDRFNQAAKELETEGLVRLEWIPNQPVFSKVVLELNHVGRAYQAIGRGHPRQTAEKVYGMIRTALSGVKTPWITAWRDEVCQTLQKEWRLPAICRKGDVFLQNILQLLTCYDNLEGETVTVRAFSIRCFQNSKRFEREFQKDFLRIAERYDHELGALCAQQELSEREKLAFLGIYAHPEYYLMSGCCTIVTSAGEVNAAPLFPMGLALPSTAVGVVEGFALNGIRRITFIENKTNYEEYLLSEQARDELVIYHGGFLSPRKRLLLEKLAACVSDGVDLFFWGDIDLGGFMMFERLRRVFPRLQPMRMSGHEVERYARFGLSRPPTYLEELNRVLQSGAIDRFYDAAEKILQYGKTIEQEVFLS